MTLMIHSVVFIVNLEQGLNIVLVCDGVVLEIYLDDNFQRRQEGLNCESLAYEVVTLNTRL